MIVRKTLNPINVKADSARCKGGQGTITVTSPLAPNIEYSIDGGTTWQLSPIFNVPAGTYTVNARVVGSLCGGFTSNILVEEPTLVTASAVPAVASCANNDGVIDITAGGGNPGYEYSIDNGVTYQTANQFLNLPVGNYNNIKVRDAYGCTVFLSATIAINDTMRLELGPDSTICFGSSITLIPQTNALTDTFKWSPKATLNFDTVKTPIAKPNDTTKFYLTAKWGVCTRKDSISINVLHKPVANAGNDTTVCYKTNATLFGSASNLSGTVNFAWSPPDSLNSPNTAITGVRLDTTRQFTLTVTDNYGCNFSVTDSVIVFMQPQLIAFAGNDTNAIINRDHQLQATGRNAVSFVWSPTGPLNNPFIANPLAVMQHDTYFYVHITDAIGCTDDDTVFIKVYEGPTYYLPNAFTPNGDTRNDIFFPTPVGIRSTDYFRVFDRYGKLMYETRQWMQGWDGTLKGKPSASGTYVWMIKGIDRNGAVVEMKGTVILLR
jgi:gliding motility-associated-like protein